MRLEQMQFYATCRAGRAVELRLCWHVKDQKMGIGSEAEEIRH